MKIIPAILPQTFRAIEGGVEKIHGTADTVQIDFVDGYFAPNKTWWFNGKDTDVLDEIMREERGMPLWDEMNYEFDLMIKDPLAHVDTFVALGPSKIVFHVESLEEEKMLHYFETLPEIVKETIHFGLALSNDTDPDVLAPYMPFVDSIQCMGIANVGFQGQAFDERVFAQIKKIKERYPDKTIAVDGAITDATIAALADAGAAEFIVGSFVFQNIDPRGTITSLARIASDDQRNA